MGLNHSILLPYMQTLAGINPPLEGRCIVMGNDSHHISQQECQLLRQKVGFVLQGGALLSVLNGIENLKLAARYHQIGDEKKIQQKALLLLSEIPHEADNNILPAYMTELQRRLLAITRALMLDPQLLFVDSPFDGLGHHDRTIIARYLSDIGKNRNITLVIGSDDLYFTHSLADQIIFCDNDEALVFDSWKNFYQCKREAIALLFEHEHIK